VSAGDALRADAFAVAQRALARRELSERELRERLARAGTEPAAADEALESLRRVGLVDDERFAAERARVLAERGKGDAAIRFDLERRGVDSDLVERVLAGLEPERARAERLVSKRGTGPRTARLLASRGFGEELIALAVGGDVAPDR
jgi:regulatory protein